MSIRPRNAVIRVMPATLLLCGYLGLGQSAVAQIKLELKYPPGRVLKAKTTSKTHQILTLNGMAIETEANQTTVSEESVGKAREDSTTPILSKVESLKVDLALPGGLNVAFDSSNPDAKIDPPQLAFLGDIFRLISQTQYTLVLDKANAVKAVEGTEAIHQKAEKLGDQAKVAVAGQLSADRLKKKFEQAQARIPDILVRTGEPWERTETLELEAGQTITFRKKYEYLGPEKKGDRTLDKIGVTTTEVKYTQDPAAQSPLKATESDLKVASSSGTILFDRAGGYVVSDQAKVQIKGTIGFNAGGQKLPGELDLTLENLVESEVGAPAK